MSAIIARVVPESPDEIDAMLVWIFETMNKIARNVFLTQREKDKALASMASAAKALEIIEGI